jgi:hypothetical protein
MAGLYREYVRVADHRATAAMAKARPGEWQRVGCYRSHASAHSTAVHARAGALAAYAPAGHFQTYLSVAEEGRCLWVRYVHGITPGPDLPEQLPEPVRAVVVAIRQAPHYVRARWAADLLADQGHTEEAALVRAWIDGGRSGRTSAHQAAAYLLRTSTTREDANQ